MKKVKSNPIKTVLVITIGFTVIYMFFDFKWAIYVAIIVGVLALVSTKLAKVINFVWMQLTRLLSFIVPNILLSIVFFFILFPIAILSKIFGNKNSLLLKNKSETLWEDKTSKITKESFEKIW